MKKLTQQQFKELYNQRGYGYGKVPDLRGCDFSGIDLTGVELEDLDLRGSDLSEAILNHTSLSGADLRGAKLPPVPIVQNIDTEIVKQINLRPSCFNMGDWKIKSPCGTSYCRAGWAVALAGKAGQELLKKVGFSWDTAGALIYAASRPDAPVPDFYCDTQDALEDLQECSGLSIGRLQ
jgi:hypothetical protein